MADGLELSDDQDIKSSETMANILTASQENDAAIDLALYKTLSSSSSLLSSENDDDESKKNERSNVQEINTNDGTYID